MIGAQKGLLNDFLGVVLIAGHAIREAVDVAAVPLHENAIGLAVAVGVLVAFPPAY